MNRVCVRCARPPSSLLAFDYARRATWLLDFESGRSGRAGHPLCEAHANGFVPPLGWHLDDRRSDRQMAFPSTAIGER